MSQKWIRSKQWDERHIPRALWPVKFLLRALSSISLAVTLLTLVAIYGTLASVPLGLLALVPTWVIYAASAVGVVGVITLVPAWAGWRVMGGLGTPRGARFAVTLLAGVALLVAGALAWKGVVWPRIAYDPLTGSGVRLFGGFVDRYASVTLRRLPAMEMSELEFYSWWPLRVVLLVFVLNMVVATVRRIEFTFANLGVLTVHTGIVSIALGSAFYARNKQEGDMLLLAGEPAPDGRPTPGPFETGFFDRNDAAVWLSQERGLQQRPVSRLPRYNAYNLRAGLPESAPLPALEAGERDYGPLSIAARAANPRGDAPQVDPDISVRLVGYAPYADLERAWFPARAAGAAPGALAAEGPVRTINLLSGLPDRNLGPNAGPPAEPRSVGTITLAAHRPAERVRVVGGVLGVEYTLGMPVSRWNDLGEPFPQPADAGLVVEVPAQALRQVHSVGRGSQLAAAGYRLEVLEILPEPPFPIITPGYEDAQTSVMLVRVTPPAGPAFTRYLYHRFPELSQDLVEPAEAGAPPVRREADPALRLAFLDAGRIQVYVDEPAGAGARVLVRLPGGDVLRIPRVGEGDHVPLAPMIWLELAERWEHAVSVERPVPVPQARRDRQLVGTHAHALAALEVTSGRHPGWARTVWVPFAQFLRVGQERQRSVQLPDGRSVRLMFSRAHHGLPGVALQLRDFEMIPYPHSETPRDYRSELLVLVEGDERAPVPRHASLNEPLLVRVPFRPRPDVPGVVNLLGRLLSTVVPMQYKFSQSGWDADGWAESSALAREGVIPRPFARYTILAVGNNPGIYIIACGAVLMGAGIPWAFYVKPWLGRRRKRKIQAELAGARARATGPSKERACAT